MDGVTTDRLCPHRIQHFLDRIKPDADAVAGHFYRELFTRNPELQQLFPGQAASLNRKFINMLGTFGQLDYLDKIAGSVEQMGGRHFQNYGAMAAHFPLFEDALMVALRTHFDDFCDQDEVLWRESFNAIAGVMQRASESAGSGNQTRHQGPQVPDDYLQQVGGFEGVYAVHRRFYSVMFADEWLGQFFYGKHESVLAQKQTEFMVAAFGGQNQYRGDTPAFVHMHMYVTDEEADRREVFLRDAILAEGMSEAVADIWLAADRSFRDAIVKQDISECVMKCRGQMPVRARKPREFS